MTIIHCRNCGREIDIATAKIFPVAEPNTFGLRSHTDIALQCPFCEVTESREDLEDEDL